MAYSLYMGREMASLPTRYEIASRREACKLSENGYQVCISNPKQQITEGAVSFSKFGWYMHDYYMVDFTDPQRGKMTLEVRREWGLTGVFKDYSLFLWDGARRLVAASQGDWENITGNRRSLSIAINILCHQRP